MLLKELKEWLEKNEKPGFEYINQGGYGMNVGNKPLAGDDHDIDVGIIFNLNIKDYPDPTVVKQWVVDALSNKPNRTVEMKFPCVRVQYFKAGEVAYHVDFAIYGKELDGEVVVNLHIAKGRKNSIADMKFWEVSQPKELKELINKKFEKEEERWQFKRIIRYLKRWKDYNFTSGRPTGIAMTSISYKWFYHTISYKWNGEVSDKSDLNALKSLLETACINNYGMDARLPVLPGNDLFEKIKNNKAHQERYIKKMEEFRDAVKEASNETDPHEAAKILADVLGPDFPIPDKKDTATRIAAPAITTSSESA